MRREQMKFVFKQQDFHKLTYTSKFGTRTHPITRVQSFHRGIDIAAPTGTEIIAPADGVVVYNRTNRGDPRTGYGHFLCIHHQAIGLFSFYAHLERRAMATEGSTVKQGEVIAYVGNTGESTGPHLHFEIHENQHKFPHQGNDSLVDPVDYYPELENFLNRRLTNLQFQEQTSQFFKDVFVDWQAEAVDALHQKGIANGRSATEFDPNGQLTRGEAAALIHRTIQYLQGGK